LGPRTVARLDFHEQSGADSFLADEPLSTTLPDEFIGESAARRIFSGVIMTRFGNQNGFIFV